MTSRNISLTDHHDTLIDTKVQSGEYANASEVVREGLRLIEERDRELAARVEGIRTRVAVGLEQAERGEFVEGTVDEIRERVRKRAKARLAGER
jgi:antitoxin ParD1/3/4